MKFLLSLSILFLIACSSQMSAVQGSDNLVTKSYEFSDFTGIRVSSAVYVELIQSDDYKVMLECNENIEEFIDIENDDHELMIGLSNNKSLSNTTINVKIYAPEISLIEASGASTIHFKHYEVDQLALHLSGASKITGSSDIDKQLDVESSGASSTKLSGSAFNVSLNYSGASIFSGKALTIERKLIIDSSGASSIKTTAEGTIDIDASGASSISYYGDGKITSSETSGAVRVNHK